jgi:hypothetical protein
MNKTWRGARVLSYAALLWHALRRHRLKTTGHYLTCETCDRWL